MAKEVSRVKVEVQIATAADAEDDGDDEVIIVPYEKPPPTVINLTESEDEERNRTSSRKSRKKKEKKTPDRARKSKSLEPDNHAAREKNSKTNRDENDKTRKSDKKSKRKKPSSKENESVADDGNENASDNSAISKSSKTTSGLTATSNIFQPSSAALEDSAYQDSNSADKPVRQSSRKRKKPSGNTSDAARDKNPRRVRSNSRNSAKSGEEESIEDTLRFVQRLGLPVVVPTSTESTNQDEAPEETRATRKKKASHKSSKSKKMKSAKEKEQQSEPDEVTDAIEEVATVLDGDLHGETATVQTDASNENVTDSGVDIRKEKSSRDPVPNSEEPVNEAAQNTARADQSEATSNPPVKRFIRLPDIFPYKWTPKMKRYYGEATNDPEDVEAIQARQSTNERIWRSDGCPSRMARNKFCPNCSQPFHRPGEDCPAKIRRVCHICGARDHSNIGNCPHSVCLSCGNTRSGFPPGCEKCTEQAKPVLCAVCGMTGHDTKNCPDHWRRYYKTTDFGFGEPAASNDQDQNQQATGNQQKRKFTYKWKLNSSCANCGISGVNAHNYFHCPQSRANLGNEYYQHKPFIIRKLCADDLKQIDIENANSSHPNEVALQQQQNARQTKRISKCVTGSAENSSSQIGHLPNIATESPAAPVHAPPLDVEPPPQVLPQPRTSPRFYEDDMSNMFDVDERNFTPQEYAQVPYINPAFASPTKEYIAIPVPVDQSKPQPLGSAAPASHTSSIQTWHNITKQAATFFGSSGKDTSKKNETKVQETKVKTSSSATPVPESTPAATVEVPVAVSTPGIKEKERRPASPEVIILD